MQDINQKLENKSNLIAAQILIYSENLKKTNHLYTQTFLRLK